jgi:Undecaprenyl-phosphate galactose phosphotransferase WbaP
MQTTVNVANRDDAIPKRSLAESSFYRQYSRIMMGVILVVTDLLCLLLAGVLAVAVRLLISEVHISRDLYNVTIPILFLFLGAYVWRGLYPGVGISPVQELQRLSVSTSVVFLLLTAFSFWARVGERYSRLVLAFAWLFSLVTVQAGRWIVRILGVRLGIWGEPVVVIGYGSQGQQIVHYLSSKLRLGLRPVLVIDGFGTDEDHTCPLPKLHWVAQEMSQLRSKLNGIQTAVLIDSEVPKALQEAIIDHGYFEFKRLIIIPDLKGIGSLGVVTQDLEGVLGLEVRQNLLHPLQRIIKRSLDIILVVLILVLLFPVLLLIAVLIRLDSPGGAFYSQDRIGHNGRRFKLWKFRTMIADAETVLDKYLQANPQLRSEWDANQKLKNDPRLTRMGCILRKLSLDEIPQLYNILIGDMSLVGPRPFLPEQMQLYGNAYKLYVRVRPGLTGLWQVSGRNSTTFMERSQWDEYYVRQWSIWLDIYILLRTIWVVIRGDGAY